MAATITADAPASSAKKPWYKILYVQVLIAIVLGAIVGWLWPTLATNDWIKAMGDGFAIDTDADGVFRVRGARIERIAAQTNFDVEESAERFQRDLARLGIDAELRRAGVHAGDLVRIGSTELEWEAQPWERT